jgi:hypothetical protein
MAARKQMTLILLAARSEQIIGISHLVYHAFGFHITAQLDVRRGRAGSMTQVKMLPEK